SNELVRTAIEPAPLLVIGQSTSAEADPLKWVVVAACIVNVLDDWPERIAGWQVQKDDVTENVARQLLPRPDRVMRSQRAFILKEPTFVHQFRRGPKHRYARIE